MSSSVTLSLPAHSKDQQCLKSFLALPCAAAISRSNLARMGSTETCHGNASTSDSSVFSEGSQQPETMYESREVIIPLTSRSSSFLFRSSLWRDAPAPLANSLLTKVRSPAIVARSAL